MGHRPDAVRIDDLGRERHDRRTFDFGGGFGNGLLECRSSPDTCSGFDMKEAEPEAPLVPVVEVPGWWRGLERTPPRGGALSDGGGASGNIGLEYVGLL